MSKGTLFEGMSFDTLSNASGAGDLSDRKIYEVIFCHLYDVVLPGPSDRAAIAKVYADRAEGINTARPRGVKRFHKGMEVTAADVHKTALALASKLVGHEIVIASESINNPRKIAGRAAAYVDTYVDFKKNATNYDKASNAGKLAKELQLVK